MPAPYSKLIETFAQIHCGGAHLAYATILSLPDSERNSADWRSAEGLCCAAMGLYERAIDCWGKLVEDGLWNASLVDQYSACLRFLSRWEEAELLIFAWYEEHPQEDSVLLLDCLADTLLAQCDATKAQKLLDFIEGRPALLTSPNKGIKQTLYRIRLKALAQTGAFDKLAQATVLTDKQPINGGALEAACHQLVQHGALAEAILVRRYLMRDEGHLGERDFLELIALERQMGSKEVIETTLADAADAHPESSEIIKQIISHCLETKELELVTRWFAKLESQEGIEPASEFEALAAQIAIAMDDLEAAERILAGFAEDNHEADAARVAFFSKLNQPQKAMHYQNRIMSEREHSIPSLLQSARLAREVGNSEMAADLCRKVLERQPNNLSARAVSLGLGGNGTGFQHLHQIQTAILDSKRKPENRAWLSHCMADFYHGAKNYSAAGSMYRRTNSIAATIETEPYSSAEHTAFISNCIKESSGYRRRDVSANRDHGHLFGNVVPVFIVGVPRSGTTLTEQILARHPNCIGMGERPYFSQLLSRYKTTISQHNFRSDQTDLWSRSEELERLEAVALQNFQSQYHNRLLVHLQHHANTERAFLVDKMPDNYINIGWIRELMPQSRIIYVRRDPREILLSCWRANFGAIKWAFTPTTIAERIIQHKRIMDHWFKLYSDSIFTCDYHRLVKEPEVTTNQMLAYLGLDWHEDCLDHTKAATVVKTASVAQVRNPINLNSIGVWENYSEELAEGIALLEESATSSAIAEASRETRSI